MLCFSPLAARAICGQFGVVSSTPVVPVTPHAGRPGKHYSKKRFEKRAEQLQRQPNLEQRVEELYQKLVGPVADQTAPPEVINELRSALKAPKDEFFSLPNARDVDFNALASSTNAIATLLWAVDRLKKRVVNDDDDLMFFMLMN